MNISKLIEKAKRLNEQHNLDRKEPAYVKSISWLCYLGVLRHSHIKGERHVVSLHELLQAGKTEPRILEILPALLIHLPEAIDFSNEQIPADLNEILNQIKKRKPKTSFRGVAPEKYFAWLKSSIFDFARRRFEYQTRPRNRRVPSTDIGAVIRSYRMQHALTQKEFSKQHELSLHALRDLEQGKLSPSLATTMQILQSCGKSLRIV